MRGSLQRAVFFVEKNTVESPEKCGLNRGYRCSFLQRDDSIMLFCENGSIAFMNKAYIF